MRRFITLPKFHAVFILLLCNSMVYADLGDWTVLNGEVTGTLSRRGGPYILYELVVPEGDSLIIEAGTEVTLDGDANIYGLFRMVGTADAQCLLNGAVTDVSSITVDTTGSIELFHTLLDINRFGQVTCRFNNYGYLWFEDCSVYDIYAFGLWPGTENHFIRTEYIIRESANEWQYGSVHAWLNEVYLHDCAFRIYNPRRDNGPYIEIDSSIVGLRGCDFSGYVRDSEFVYGGLDLESNNSGDDTLYVERCFIDDSIWLESGSWSLPRLVFTDCICNGGIMLFGGGAIDPPFIRFDHCWFFGAGIKLTPGVLVHNCVFEYSQYPFFSSSVDVPSQFRNTLFHCVDGMHPVPDENLVDGNFNGVPQYHWTHRKDLRPLPNSDTIDRGNPDYPLDADGSRTDVGPVAFDHRLTDPVYIGPRCLDVDSHENVSFPIDIMGQEPLTVEVTNLPEWLNLDGGVLVGRSPREFTSQMLNVVMHDGAGRTASYPIRLRFVPNPFQNEEMPGGTYSGHISILNDVTVPEGDSLVFEPGTQLHLVNTFPVSGPYNSEAWLSVHGDLVMNGTREDSVRIIVEPWYTGGDWNISPNIQIYGNARFSNVNANPLVTLRFENLEQDIELDGCNFGELITAAIEPGSSFIESLTASNCTFTWLVPQKVRSITIDHCRMEKLFIQGHQTDNPEDYKIYRSRINDLFIDHSAADTLIIENCEFGSFRPHSDPLHRTGVPLIMFNECTVPASITGCTFYDSDYAIEYWGSSELVVERNTFHHMRIVMYVDGLFDMNVKFNNNVCTNVLRAVMVGGTDDLEMEMQNNLFHLINRAVFSWSTNIPDPDSTNLFASADLIGFGPYPYRPNRGSAAIDIGSPDLPSDPDGTRADAGAWWHDQDNPMPEITSVFPDTGIVDMQNSGELFFLEANDPNGDELFYAFRLRDTWYHDIQELRLRPEVDFVTGDTLWGCVTDGNSRADAMWYLFSTDAAGERDTDLPLSWDFSAPYPNPANPSCRIAFSTPVASDVTVTVYNLLGREVRQLFLERALPGHHVLSWDGADNGGIPVSSGMYFIRLYAPAFTRTQKCLLLR